MYLNWEKIFSNYDTEHNFVNDLSKATKCSKNVLQCYLSISTCTIQCIHIINYHIWWEHKLSRALLWNSYFKPNLLRNWENCCREHYQIDQIILLFSKLNQLKHRTFNLNMEYGNYLHQYSSRIDEKFEYINLGLGCTRYFAIYIFRTNNLLMLDVFLYYYHHLTT